MRFVVSGVIFIVLGLTGKFVLIGTNSTIALIVAGFVLLVIGIIQIVKPKRKNDDELIKELELGTIETLPLRNLKLRIILLSLFCLVFIYIVFKSAIGIHFVLTDPKVKNNKLDGILYYITYVIVFTIPTIITYLSFQKTRKWNTTINKYKKNQ